MHAVVDPETCIGCGLCPTICPEVFEMKEDIAVVIADPVPAGAQDSCREAEESCPVDAITVEE